MSVNMVPELVTIEGEYDDGEDYSFMGYDPDEVAELLGIDYEDAYMLTDRPLDMADTAYLDMKYPEYMGIWPLLAKAGALIVKGGVAIGKGIAKAVKKKKADKKAKSNAAAEAAAAQKRAEEQRIAAIAAERIRKQEEQKRMMTIALPIAGLAAIMLLKK